MWHATFDDGNDTEFALVIAALCLGLGYIAARLIFRSGLVALIFSRAFAPHHKQTLSFVRGFHSLGFTASSPPLHSLRI